MKKEIKLYLTVGADTVNGLTLDKSYEILAKFDTDLCGSGHCIVVNNDKQNIVGYDATHFIQKLIIKGYIRILIDKKPYFQPEGLKKPSRRIMTGNKFGDKFIDNKFIKAMEEYKLSRELIEIDNENYANHFYLDDNEELDSFWIIIKNKKNLFQNNQPCKTEIINNKANIIKLITKE